jgi:sarcosine oxidase subunit gamma
MRLTSWLPEYRNGKKRGTIDGPELPSEVGATVSGGMHVLCMGPAEWLIVSTERAACTLRERIEPGLARQGLVLVDLSDGLAGLAVQGVAARDLLSKGCGLDFHPRIFPAGQCARTRFAQIPIIIDCLDEPPRFELYVARSYLHYLHAWLIDAAVEFGNPFA